MEKKAKYRNKLIVAAIIFGLYLINKYQHTEAFQSTMNSLFNLDVGVAVPPFWQNNRMLSLGVLIVALSFYYKPIWYAYKHLIQTYRNSLESSHKPPLSPLQACYFYQQDQIRCVVTWLIDLCRQGALSLYYKKGFYPWSISRGSISGLNDLDQHLVEILFQEGNRVHLKASFSKPNPHIKESANKLYKNIESENSHFFRARKSNRPAWFLFFALIVEALFCTAIPGSEIIVVTITALFSAGLLAVTAFFFIIMLPSLLTGPRGTAVIVMTVVTTIALFGHWILFFLPDIKVPYLTTAMYPSLVATIAVIVKCSPLMPDNSSSLLQIIAYKKYLGRDNHRVTEEDLPWTLGLGVHGDIIESAFYYDGQTTPEWIKSKEDDVQGLMRSLHQTLYRCVKDATFGESRSHRSLSGGGRGEKY